MITIYGKIVITGAVYISQLLNVTHTLQQLIMGSNDIGDDGMAVISEALQHNKSLTILWVGQCGLSVKGTVNYVASLNYHISNYYNCDLIYKNPT